MLLIISNKKDLSTDYLILRIKDRGVKYIRINTEDYLNNWDFHISSNNHVYSTILRVFDKSISIEEINGAYIRQPELPVFKTEAEDQLFVKREIGESLRSFWRSINDTIWLNAPHKILRSSNKPEQLKIAAKIGFNIPDTCISNNYDIAYNFFKKHQGKVVAKAVKHGFDYNGCRARVAPTQLIDINLFENFDSYFNIPMIYQECIVKKYDIRITVVGNNVLATAIYSQVDNLTKIDWRLHDTYNIDLKHQKVNVPQYIVDYCLSINKHYGLRYSAIDMILSEEGVYYFLEINPNGQWAWLEQKGLHNIRDCIIDELIKQREYEY
ncbi:MvdC/MvdD family ATP grasp protein [Oceanospirillum sediminis]|uniref:ATP-grasp domain-containing protein n=1 Tax=Oceanospirillum sediminis TaxID=2760088 RepID=A0A839IYQ4_9GAMM|nr:hypothetical protein [Oceanospirillum sediminis]MBB1489569.1 hypothetical protein [Oceanospirillum sediminis]